MQQSAKPKYATWNWRALRYGPVLLWLTFIFFASTDNFSASHTSRIIRPLLHWLCPSCVEAQIVWWHGFIRKMGHFTEYGLLALLVSRAFATSTRAWVRNHWVAWAVGVIIAYALLDEYHQSFVPTRTASIYDSMIDTAGGLAMLAIYYGWQRRQQKRLVRIT